MRHGDYGHFEPWFLRAACLLLCLTLFVLSSASASETASTSDKRAVQAEQNDKHPPARRLTARERAAARKAAREAAAQAKKDTERQKWVARLQARDVVPWPEKESDKRHATALQESRSMSDEVIPLYPGTELYETEHFLVTTNIPREQIEPYTRSLDRMYDWMCRLYGVERSHKVWLGGKAPIFAFLEREQFDTFEQRFFPDARASLGGVTNIYGLCHLSDAGHVVIACYRGEDPNSFGQMLVHETSHGFIHRYKTKAALPNWVDEGMADLIGAEMVPASNVVKNREIKAIQQLSEQRSLGGMLTAKRISPWQYGVASNLNRFLLQADRDSYVRFIELLKEGMTWEESLGAAYGSTPQQLLAHYGHRIGVADLRP